MIITPSQLASSGTEHGHQCALFCWAAQNYELYPELRNLFAIPNGGFRNKATAGRLKAEGVKSGVSDMFLPVPIGRYPNTKFGLFLELKVGKNEPTQEQHSFMTAMQRNGYVAVWCIGWEMATKILVSYLEGKY